MKPESIETIPSHIDGLSSFPVRCPRPALTLVLILAALSTAGAVKPRPPAGNLSFVVEADADRRALYLCAARDVTGKHVGFLDFEFRTRNAILVRPGKVIRFFGNDRDVSDLIDVQSYDDHTYRVVPLPSQIRFQPELSDDIAVFSEVPRRGRILVASGQRDSETSIFRCYDLAGHQLWKFSVPGDHAFFDHSIDRLVWVDDRYFVSVSNGRMGTGYRIYDAKSRALIGQGFVRGWIRVIGGKVLSDTQRKPVFAAP